MIKKLLSFVAVAAFFGTATAQSSSMVEQAGTITRQGVVEFENGANLTAKTASVLVGDTLWYYFNKHYYRNPSGTGFYTLKCPTSSTAYTTDRFGNIFKNAGSLTITGLEAFASRQASSPTASITMRILLYNVTAGMPVLPALDSITAVLTGTAATQMGGNFLNPKVVTGDYAVMYRKVGGVNGDTIRAWMNNAYTSTATTGTSAQKYGEGMGLSRISGTVMSMTGLYGADTDFEFLVAPRVGFQGITSASSPTVSPYCTNNSYTFNNTSSYWFGHRMYNLNQFYRTWKPFTNTVTISPAPDSVFTWNFGDGTGNKFTTTGNPNISHIYTAAGVFSGTLTTKYRRMSDSGYGVQDAATTVKSVSTCAGINTISGIEAVVLFPNPSSNGSVNINNLPSESSIEVVNMLGQSVFKDKADAGAYTTDLSSLPKGSYFVKISSVNEKTKIVKLILN